MAFRDPGTHLETQPRVPGAIETFPPSSAVNPSLPLHGELPASPSRPRWAMAAKGFRPFFLLAAAFAVAIVPLWLLALFGVI